MTDQIINPKKLFVGSLPFSTTQDELTNLFAPYGDITELKLIIDRHTSQSRGIAFVEFADEEAAQNAINALNGTQLENRNIIVNVAKPQAPRDNGGFRSNNRRNFTPNRQRGY